MKKAFLLHPILFAIFPGISIVADHLGFISFNATLLLLTLGVLLLASIIFILLRFLSNNSAKAAVGTSLFLILFFSYGHAFDYLKNETAVFIQHRHLTLVGLIVYLILFTALLRTKKELTLVNQWLTVMGGMLLLFSGYAIATYYLTEDTNWLPERTLAGKPANAAQTLPDVYYIIFDAYANEATLNAYYNFDNRDFLNGLEERGFYVANESRSNYALTSLSISSSLNLTYVNELSQQIGEDSTSITIPKQLIEQNEVMNFFQAAGYQFVFMGSGYGVSQSNRFATQDIHCGQVDETIGRFIATSFLRAPADRFRLIERDDRQRRLCMFHELENMPNTESPKFIFAHVPSPHWPFLFDAEGNPVSLENLNHDQLKDGYLAQLIYLNGRITRIVDAILENSASEPIIIIQSDHGPAFESSMDTPTKSLYEERMRILNAYYLPEEAKAVLYPSITPINSFRVVFNHIFATELPLLDDQSYFSTYKAPYKFTNVTDQIVSR